MFGTIDLIETASGFLRLLISGILGVSIAFIIVAIRILKSNSFGMGPKVIVTREGNLKKLVIHKSCKDFKMDPGGTDKLSAAVASELRDKLQADPGNTQIQILPGVDLLFKYSKYITKR